MAFQSSSQNMLLGVSEWGEFKRWHSQGHNHDKRLPLACIPHSDSDVHLPSYPIFRSCSLRSSGSVRSQVCARLRLDNTFERAKRFATTPICDLARQTSFVLRSRSVRSRACAKFRLRTTFERVEQFATKLIYDLTRPPISSRSQNSRRV